MSLAVTPNYRCVNRVQRAVTWPATTRNTVLDGNGGWTNNMSTFISRMTLEDLQNNEAFLVCTCHERRFLEKYLTTLGDFDSAIRYCFPEGSIKDAYRKGNRLLHDPRILKLMQMIDGEEELTRGDIERMLIIEARTSPSPNIRGRALELYMKSKGWDKPLPADPTKSVSQLMKDIDKD